MKIMTLDPGLGGSRGTIGMKDFAELKLNVGCGLAIVANKFPNISNCGIM